MKHKDCGCYGPGHHTNCKEYKSSQKDFVSRFVGTEAGKVVWNAALDEAAKRCDEVLECKAAARIRELRK